MFADVVLERLDGIHLMGNAHVVIHQGIFARGQAKLTLAGFQRMQILDNALVVRHEGKRTRHLAKHNGLAPENLGALVRIHAGVIHAVTAANHKPAETHLFHRFHETAFLVPRRRKPATRAEGFCHLHNPFRFDFGGLIEENAARLAHLGAKEPFCALAVKVTAREHVRLAPAHQAVTAIFEIPQGYTTQESRKKSYVQVIAVETVERADAILEFYVEDAPELFVQIYPFAAPQEMQAVLVAELAQLVPGLAIPFSAEGVPHADEREEIALVACELAVQLANAGAVRFFARYHARVLDAQGRADNQRGLQYAGITRPQEHSRERHVHREARHLAAKLGHMPVGVIGGQRAEFKKRLVRAAKCRMRRRLQEREILEFQPEAAQLQNHVREITPPDFRLRKLVPLLEILGRIKTYANTGLYASRTPCALPGTRLRDVLDGQSLDSRLRVVPRNAGRTRINHIGDSRNRERSFRDVRREHHAGLFRMPEDAALFVGAHAPVKRQDVKGRGVQFVRKFACQILDVAFRR